MQTNEITSRFNQIAQQYDEQRRFFVPRFDDFYGTCTEFLRQLKPEMKNILELGAGTGLLTKYLYAQYPQADFTLVDISQQMLALAKERFSGMPNFKFTIADYSHTLPEGKYDLIASALSIHHLNAEEKRTLYTNCRAHLNEGGIFINFDIYDASSSFLNERFNNYWYEHIRQSDRETFEKNDWRQRRELDKECTQEDCLTDLHQAGYSQVECIYSFLKFRVILGIK
jgi:ubiquinone/menaquinone biosynthesis C-methylase UbiE